ncbi:hypothetical protein Pmani_029342 [Petrolisthes manimaculis]|uniref:Uncharacterized protein n=1 Tax=Petrolisthes manimaculis TaxID=1843537 RepID=A0AAE1NZR5_9EUCA|nr:hypothetical protein Pmani_029342 [Petrolisthes manimaculis]
MRYKNNNERCVGEKDKKQVKDGKIREVEAKKKQIKNGKKKGVEVKEKEQVKDGTKKGVKVKEKKQVEDGKKKGVEVKNKKQVGRKRMRQVEKDSNVGGVNKKRLIGKREKRWTGALDKLYYTLVEQRWEEAFALLPCVLLQPPPQIPNSLLWKVIDVVSLNAHSVPIDLREQLRRHVCELQVSAEEVVLDSLPKLAPTFDNSRVTELRQFLDDVAVHNLMLPWDGKKRVKELCEASIAKIEQHRWMSSYSEDEQDIEDGNFGNSSNTKEMKEARSLYTLLKKSYKGLEEPAEWLLLSLLMQECEVYGKDKATATLDNHLYAYPHRPPALRLALYCHRTFLPTSVQQQTQLLKTLVTVCPSDPRVLDYIDHLLKERKGSATEDKHTEARNAFDSNSDSGMDEGNKAAPIGSCFLKSEERVSTLLECLEMLVNLLYYQEFVWELKPWAKLTELLSYFYTSWLRCWSCGLCKGSRKRVRKMTILVCLVWQYLVWLPPSPQLSHDKAEVLLHHVFAAHIFCHNNERYMKLCRRVVKSVGLEKALDNLLFPPCSDSYLHEKFILYVQKKHSSQGQFGHTNLVPIVEYWVTMGVNGHMENWTSAGGSPLRVARGSLQIGQKNQVD